MILGSAAGLGSRALARQEQMSRTTVRRWLARFVIKRCDGLQDRPRSGRPLAIKPTTRALVVALACERPADRDVPLSRYSLSPRRRSAQDYGTSAGQPKKCRVRVAPGRFLARCRPYVGFTPS